MVERESMEFDVVIVGAGPAGLSASIQLKKLAQENNLDVSVCVVDDGQLLLERHACWRGEL